MTTEDRDFAKKIATYLDRGVAELRSGTAYRLQLARSEALARLADPKRAARPQLVLSGAGTGSIGGRYGFRIGARYWLGILIVVLTLFGFQQWQAYQQLRDIEETDAAILSSDLPIDAYLDRGFQNWLKHVSDDGD
jgi:Protein of unknown function (DUF3619)